MKYPDDDDRTFDVVLEAQRLFHVAMPSVAVQFNLMIIFQQSASVVGRDLGTNELGGFSLGTLVGNMTCLSVIVGALSAADTLMPRAYGAKHYDEIGRLAIRGVVVCFLLLLPALIVFLRPSTMQWILGVLGQDPVASRLASFWIPVYLCGMPANMVFRVMQRFLVSQKAAWPPVIASMIPTYVLHPILLKTLVSMYGLPGSAMAIATTQWLCLISLFIYLHFRQEHHPDSFPGLSLDYIRESVRPAPLRKFMNLSVGGVMALSEWWFWETMCFVAGSFGVVELCAHTIAYNMVPISFMIPLGVSIGLTVRMGTVLATNPYKAKLMAACTMALIFIIATIEISALWFFQTPIIKIFTSDPKVIAESQAIWHMVCFHIWILHIFGISSGILKALGMQWHIATIVLFMLWFFTLPLVFWFAVKKEGGLHTEWKIMPSCYFVMQFVLAYAYMSLNWEKKSEQILKSQQLAQMESKGLVATETTPLVTVDV